MSSVTARPTLRDSCSSARGGDRDLHTVAAAGGESSRLAGAMGDDSRPFWSPNGTLIAFSSDRDGDNDVYAVAPDGTGGGN